MTMQAKTITLEVFQDVATGTYQVVNQPGQASWGKPPVDTKDEPSRWVAPTEKHSGYQWAPWGLKDQLPTSVRKMVEQVPMAGQAIYRLMAMMYGNGLAYYRNSDLEGGNTDIKRAYIPQIEQWLKRCQLRHRWLIPQFFSYRHTVNCFSQMIFSRDRRSVTGIYHLDSEFSRKSIQDKRSLRSEYVYYSADFAADWRGHLKHAVAIPLLDWMADERWVERMRGYKAAWHSCLPTPGMIYYATPPWVGLFRERGWMEAAIAVPEIVYAMQRNQIMLKYQILIPQNYFAARYPDWDNYDTQKKEDLMDEVATFIENELSDTENAYKSITTFFNTDLSGRELGKIEIVAIDDKIKRDGWVPSSNAADAQIVQGLGLHPSQLGLAPEGGKMGAGSGSDQREAWNTGIQLNTLEQEIVLEPLNWIARYNAQTKPEWDVTFFIDHTAHTTTNLQENGLVPSATTLSTDG